MILPKIILLYNKVMNYKTYLQESFKNGQLMRWTYMPLVVFIAPMNFYSKQGQDYKYKNMVIKALEVWQKAAAGQIQIQLTDDLLSSNVNVEWRRVDRKALGHCLFNYDNQNRLYSAEVSIGLSDGVIHQQYMADGEVYHTILHEIGHAFGLEDVYVSSEEKDGEALNAKDVSQCVICSSKAMDDWNGGCDGKGVGGFRNG